jgi:hypothetical protein
MRPELATDLDIREVRIALPKGDPKYVLPANSPAFESSTGKHGSNVVVVVSMSGILGCKNVFIPGPLVRPPVRAVRIKIFLSESILSPFKRERIRFDDSGTTVIVDEFQQGQIAGGLQNRDFL